MDGDQVYQSAALKIPSGVFLESPLGRLSKNLKETYK